MSSSTATRYLDLFRDDRPGMLALLACSAAFQLDDGTACEIVELVANSNGATSTLVQQVKRLGCVWKDWNGEWHVAEDVRRELTVRLRQELPDDTVIKLRKHLAQKADSRAQVKSTDQLAAHQILSARLEAAYQRILIPQQLDRGANDLLALWRQLSPSDAQALARSVDYLADELSQLLGRLPDTVLFLRGMAARDRADPQAQQKHFLKIWKDGHEREPGYIHAKAAHSLGLLLLDRDLTAAENALHDSVRWMEAGRERGLAYLSLGKLIASYPARLDEARIAYKKALKSFTDPDDQAQAESALAELRSKTSGAVSWELTGEVPEWAAELWAHDVQIAIDELAAPVEKEMYEFAESYVAERGFGSKSDTAALVNELYAKFFRLREDLWEDEKQFFVSTAHVMRQVLLEHAQSFPTLSLAISEAGNQGEAFGTRLTDYFFDIHEALKRLHKLDSGQSRIVELRFYAGLSTERIAAVLKIPEATVLHEWRIAKAFLKREVRTAKTVRQVLNVPSLVISSKALSIELG
jgi:RNA polymerase sigma factor (TIGR02999 family)